MLGVVEHLLWNLSRRLPAEVDGEELRSGRREGLRRRAHHPPCGVLHDDREWATALRGPMSPATARPNGSPSRAVRYSWAHSPVPPPSKTTNSNSRMVSSALPRSWLASTVSMSTDPPGATPPGALAHESQKRRMSRARPRIFCLPMSRRHSSTHMDRPVGKGTETSVTGAGLGVTGVGLDTPKCRPGEVAGRDPFGGAVMAKRVVLPRSWGGGRSTAIVSGKGLRHPCSRRRKLTTGASLG